MARSAFAGLDRRRLRLWLALFFLALAVPTALLIRQAYSQLKWEAFHQYRGLAEELAARIDGRLIELINGEEARSFTDYSFLVVAGDPTANFLQRSPLSVYPLAAGVPGLIGYFQVDAQGRLSTPLLPASATEAAGYGVAAQELLERQALQQRILDILAENRLVNGAVPHRLSALVGKKQEEAKSNAGGYSSAEAGRDEDRPVVASEAEQAPAQAAFDKLGEVQAKRKLEEKTASSALGRLKDIKQDSGYAAAPRPASPPAAAQNIQLLEKRGARKERSALPEPQLREADAAREDSLRAPARVRTFESELDPFELSLLDSGQFVLYRKVWRDGQRYIQGALIDREPFLQGVVETLFRDTAVSRMSDLVVAFQGKVFASFNGRGERYSPGASEELCGELLYQTRLSAPLSELELLFTVTQMPSGPGAGLIGWLALILALVLSGGCWLLYRVGARQIDLTRQQQDFVSAVSHELKTPLTSIRMYGEMLREGWVGEDKKTTYYDFIHSESERLSRLIDNVLQLARMTRNDLRVELKPLAAAQLMDTIRSKVASQIERAGFTLNVECGEDAGRAVVNVDPDYFAQIVINLVDNALKFSAKAENRSIGIACRLESARTVQFCVRDYGPGIPREQLKKIFRLFYRLENEMTRETVGTGIGLALVRQLAQAMQGRVDVVNREPGAEFCVSFPLCD
ncbi:MAG TPA: HAMP domain-containing sensor histidine kinase [Methylococcaceae bacterium]|nr:HAMP domain-containing sensor histidine kinase [Methylococcaceae bacterium]